MEMDFPAWPSAACVVPPELLPALGIDTARVLKARDYLVVVERSEQVRALAPDFMALARLESGIGGVIVTAPGDGDIDYVTRFFCPAIGINEDAATGSISCTLAPYWADRLGKRTLRARQLSERGGELWCRSDGNRVKIAGQARLYLQGVLEL